MENIAFQVKAIDELVCNIKNLWTKPERQIPIVFVAPTGSGKTYMTEKMICDLAQQPDWNQEVAFVWITFSDDLAMQSKEKFDAYFPTEKHGRLLTIEDFNLGSMQKHDVLFLNWQKLVSKSADDRIYRRPTDSDAPRHESRVYFEDFVENTHNNGVEIILIIDEAHLNVTEASKRDVIDPLNPKIKLNVSATPKTETIGEAAIDGAIVKIEHSDVVAAGLIKESLICQTEEELKKYSGEDMDHTLLKLAIDKRNELKKEIESFGSDVNPLVIIQLPNDDADLLEEGKPTKEEITKKYLVSQGVKENRIASWFTGKEKPVGLELNNSEYEYLLFKTAAGTGWDCPRAQVLVMFREVKSEIFHTQTIGRILRVPIMNEEVSKVFRNGFIYTNYSRNAVESADYGGMNKPKTMIATSKENMNYELDPKLLTDFLSRVDYGDLGKSGEFQQCLFDTFNEFFDIQEEDRFDVLVDKLEAKGVDVASKFIHDIISDTEFKDFEKIGVKLKESHEVEREWSASDVQKWFTLTLVNILRSQTDEDCKVGNIVRSVPTLKSAVRLWFKYYALPHEGEDRWYRVFLDDAINKETNSLFRPLVTKTLKNYHPILEKQLNERREENAKRQSEVFVLKKNYAFTEEYEPIAMKKCLFEPFYLRKDYTGRKTEEEFARFLDSQDSVVWWFKNGDSGKDWLGFRYFNEVKKQESLFYPDWIFKMTDGTIGIFDTKGGQTASSIETKNKAEALKKRLQTINGWNRATIRYVGGIVIKANGSWYYNDNATYSYQQNNTDGWKSITDLFKSVLKDKSPMSLMEENVPSHERYTHYLPLYPLRAACGAFESGDALPDDEAEGWVDVSSCGFTPNKNMFIVKAKGDSMVPKIKDGDLCVFELYGPENGGSRNGKTVLAKLSGKDDDYLCEYTIKQYSSEVDPLTKEHTRITLKPLNTDGYQPIELSPTDEGAVNVIAVLKCVIE